MIGLIRYAILNLKFEKSLYTNLIFPQMSISSKRQMLLKD
jgi:hypothetical protein